MLEQGDVYAVRGDVKAASSFYQSALKAASQTPSLEYSTRAKLDQAASYVRQQAENYRAALKRAVAGRPTKPDGTDRLRDAVEIMTGDRELFLQQPTTFYYPYLPNRQFFDRNEFGWVPAFEAETPVIKAELRSLLQEGADFRPYVEDDPDRPHREFYGLHGDASWTALYLWKNGAPVEANAVRCPRTMAALERVPMSRISGQTPSVLFSRLMPGAHIAPHRGMLNCRLICHLPLIAPHGCWLRVGSETRALEEGRLLIFDDSIQHEAKNESSGIRIVLLFDIWRPELAPDEQAGISTIFETIASFTDLPPA
jgi:aspartyl/asparaginyl beta-hydroxylase (cupin superfamily)